MAVAERAVIVFTEVAIGVNGLLFAPDAGISVDQAEAVKQKVKQTNHNLNLEIILKKPQFHKLIAASSKPDSNPRPVTIFEISSFGFKDFKIYSPKRLIF
jgi:hypothetical protein